jgi:hypothetical protein
MSGDDINPIVDPDDVNPDDPDDGGEEYTPPTKEEWEKVQRTLKARKADAATARREAAAAKEAAAKGKDGAADDTAKQEAQAASDNRARRSAGITALVEAGMTKAQAKDALPLMKLDKLAVDQDGDVDDDDLSDAVDTLKEKFPGLFAKDGTARPKAPKARTADGGGRDGGTKTATDRTTARLMKAAGF